jgi:Zn-dependent protease with chaperone function
MSVARYLSQAIIDALVAAVVVELLISAWREGAPGQRIRLRQLVLGLSLAAVPLLDRLAPQRREEWFEERLALLTSRHWAELTVGGVGLSALFLGGLGALGAALFLADLIPFLRQVRLGSGAPPLSMVAPARGAARPAGWPRVAADWGVRAEQELSRLCAAARLEPPLLTLSDERTPLLLCRGVRSPEILVSRGALALLDDAELRGALAHELAHLRSRDPAWSWALLAVRALQAFNPVVQVVVRAIAQDAERRADDLAARATGDRLALASAMVKLYRVSAATSGEFLWGPLLARTRAKARASAIEERCRRLLGPPCPAPAPHAGLRLAAACLSLLGLLVFVV